MKIRILIPFFALLYNCTNAQQTNIKQLTTQFDRLLGEQFKPKEPGATALIARHGEVLYKKAFGMANLELDVPMQINNVFRIASITKQFTAVAILQLMEKGKLDLQDEITKYIPDYPTQGNIITIEHLLTHTSGIQDFSSMKDIGKRGSLDYTPIEMIDWFKNQPMRFVPGSKWEYSNSGYFLLGYIIEKITGKAYADYLEEKIFKPLGMTHSLYANDIKIIKNRAGAYTKDDNVFKNAPYLSMTQPFSAGSIQATVEDLYKWQQAVQSYKLVKKESLDKAFTRYKLNNGSETNYGYGWRFGYIQESPSIWHGGAINGFKTMSIYLPKEDVFIALFSNCDCQSLEDITSKLAALAIGQPYVNKPMPVESSVLAEYTGVYENKKGEQRIISLEKNKLYSQRGRTQKLNVQPFHRDKFFFSDDAMQTIVFSRNKRGEIEKLTMLNRTSKEIWNKSNNPIQAETVITLDEKILERFVGEYEITPDFKFAITKEQDRLFLQATGQEKVELFAESGNKFFLKENGAKLEFIKDDSGKVIKAILNQGGRQADAKRIK